MKPTDTSELGLEQLMVRHMLLSSGNTIASG